MSSFPKRLMKFHTVLSKSTPTRVEVHRIGGQDSQQGLNKGVCSYREVPGSSRENGEESQGDRRKDRSVRSQGINKKKVRRSDFQPSGYLSNKEAQGSNPASYKRLPAWDSKGPSNQQEYLGPQPSLCLPGALSIHSDSEESKSVLTSFHRHLSGATVQESDSPMDPRSISQEEDKGFKGMHLGSWVRGPGVQ